MYKERIYSLLPDVLQNLLISIFNILAYRKRYGGKYKKFLSFFKKNDTLSLDALGKIEEEKFIELINNSYQKSKFYRELYKDVKLPTTLFEINNLPIVNKEKLRENIEDIYTVNKKEGIVSKTGGTTGKSLEVIFTKENMQERFAMLDNFRLKSGYKLGKKTAWFSGKHILNKRDVSKKRFWKTDYIFNVRYYSTFHIREDYLKCYIDNLLNYSPEYIVGFPSSISEIAKLGLKKGLKFPPNTVKAIFPTAESVTIEMRKSIEVFFNSKIYNQYASSEGAPFIFECSEGNLHLEKQSGVFEVLDENDQPTKSGRLVFTSFTTEGTPLIRYDIGDSISLSDDICKCGNNNPLVGEILGRVDDFIFSPENGKINLGNVSNTLKDVKGIIKFQVVQNKIDEIEIFIVKDQNVFTEKYEAKFLQNWRDRIGKKMRIELLFVDNITSEKSGKFRIVKNNIKHLL